MKRNIIISLAVIAVIAVSALIIQATPALAAKPQQSGSGKDVIAISNGFPSGDHETLNIHGKRPGSSCVECNPSIIDPITWLPVQCNVIDIPEYGTAQISYVSGSKVKIDELTVFDSCAGFDPPGQEDGAEVWIPYEAKGYWVFARALGTPANGNPNDPGYVPRRIIFQNAESTPDLPNPAVYSLFDYVSNPNEVKLTLPLGMITQDGVYKLLSTDAANINLVRFDPLPTGKGRGKTLGKNITDMFMWSGTVYHWILDVNNDGAVDELDVPSVYDTDGIAGISEAEFQAWLNDNTHGWVFPDSIVDTYDQNNDGVLDESDALIAGYDTNPIDGKISDVEFRSWLISLGLDPNLYWFEFWHSYETPVWVFTIADLVYQNQVVHNYGIKNLQIRFYPVEGTTFTPPSLPPPTDD